MHELAHAYHHRVLPEGFANPELKSAYEQARLRGKYDRVERRFGNGRTDLDLPSSDGTKLHLVARSIGGGEVEITRVGGRPVRFNGAAWEVLLETPAAQAELAA